MYTSRKWLALFVLMLLAAVLAACANDEPTPTVDPQPVATEAPVVAPAETPIETAATELAAVPTAEPVSYTHLDVYKRQALFFVTRFHVLCSKECSRSLSW